MKEYYYPLWNGLTKSDIFYDFTTDAVDYAEERIALFENAKQSRWDDVLYFLFNEPDEISPNSELVYAVELDNPNLNTLLHYAALTNANIDVIQKLVQAGSPRTRRNVEGQRPIDIAREKGYSHLYSTLQPEIKHSVPLEELQQIEHHFHNVILNRAKSQVEKHGLQLPQLEMLLELDTASAFFTIPDSMDGFPYCLRKREFGLVLFSFNAPLNGLRVGLISQMYKITVSGSEVIAEGDDTVLAFSKEYQNYP